MAGVGFLIEERGDEEEDEIDDYSRRARTALIYIEHLSCPNTSSAVLASILKLTSSNPVIDRGIGHD